jgi:hypothetical protein
MKRRDMLALAGGSLTLAIAGCSGDGDGDDGDNETQDNGTGDDGTGDGGTGDDGNNTASATFEVSGVTTVTSPVNIGTAVEVDAEVSNTGEASGEDTVQLLVDGQLQDSQEVELDAGASETVTLSLPTTDLDAGDHEITVAVGDSENSATITLETPDPAAFEVGNLTPLDGTATVGTSLEVSAEVTNTGEQTGQTTVEFRLNGATQDSQQIELDGGASQTVSFEIDLSDLEVGEFTHSIVAGDGEATGSLVVEAAEPEAGNLLVNVLDVEAVPIEGATVTGDAIEGQTDAEGRFEQELEVGTYDLTITSGELEATRTVEITADQTTEVTVELAPDTSDLPAIDGFSGENTSGFIAFGEDSESAAREEGIAFEEGSVRIEATVEDGTWESTNVEFETLMVRGYEAKPSTDGLSGEINREEDTMTAEGTLTVSVLGNSFSFQIATTTGTSGALEGEADLGAESGTATLVDNEFTVESSGDGVLDSVLGLPIEESGRAWVEYTFDLQFQTAE